MVLQKPCWTIKRCQEAKIEMVENVGIPNATITQCMGMMYVKDAVNSPNSHGPKAFDSGHHDDDATQA